VPPQLAGTLLQVTLKAPSLVPFGTLTEADRSSAVLKVLLRSQSM